MIGSRLASRIQPGASGPSPVLALLNRVGSFLGRRPRGGVAGRRPSARPSRRNGTHSRRYSLSFSSWPATAMSMRSTCGARCGRASVQHSGAPAAAAPPAEPDLPLLQLVLGEPECVLSVTSVREVHRLDVLRTCDKCVAACRSPRAAAEVLTTRNLVVSR